MAKENWHDYWLRQELVALGVDPSERNLCNVKAYLENRDFSKISNEEIAKNQDAVAWWDAVSFAIEQADRSGAFDEGAIVSVDGSIHLREKEKTDRPFKTVSLELGYDELVWLAVAFKWAYRWVRRDNRPHDNGNPDTYMPYIHGTREHILAQLDETLAQKLFVENC